MFFLRGMVVRRARTILTLGAWVVFLGFGLAGVAKLIELNAFEAHLRDWTIVPDALAPLVALLVPMFEFGLAGLWIVGRRGRRVAAAALLFAFLLGGVSVAQYATHPVPECGCLGILAKYARLEAGLPKLIGVNVGAVLVLAAWLVVVRPDQARGHETESSPAARLGRDQASTPAYTLIEAILIVAIIGLLIALLLPSLGRARLGAQDTVSLSNMRQHASVYAAYATDFDDYSPYPVDPDATLNVFRGGGQVVEAEYFWVTELWQFALADAYYDAAVFSDSFSHPLDRQNGTWITYRMTSSFLADPRYWVDRPDRDVSLWGGVRVTQTRFPADKAWLIEFHPRRGIPVGLGSVGQSREGVGLAFVDGHSERLNGPQLTVPLFYGDGLVDQALRQIGIFGMHTPDGALGRDKR
ncbi:MAG: hypothetical protein R3B57_04580 [Phycisphaerales bacterium]